MLKSVSNATNFQLFFGVTVMLSTSTGPTELLIILQLLATITVPSAAMLTGKFVGSVTLNEDASAESNGVPANGSEAPVAENADKSPANTTSSANPDKANDNQVAERPAKRNPATIAEPAKTAQSKPAATQTTKPFSVTSAPVSGDVETNARRVIRGDFGNGQERKDKLGSSYSEIQGKVNEMYRQGIVN